MIRRVILLIFMVISFYIFFTTPSTLAPNAFDLNTNNYYSLLSKGFLSGQLSLPILPSAQLLGLPDPYNPIENNGLRLHDASLYEGKYYLYFGPLPALTFFIPFKLITNHYPTETLSVLFFLSTGFIVLFILMIRIKECYFPEVSEAQVLLAGLLLAFTTAAPFLLTRGLFYESAIASAFCAMSFALYFLYNAISNHFSKIKDVLLFSFFLALTVAGRPNFSLICFVLIPAVLICIFKYAPRIKWRSLIVALVTPITLIASGLSLYNYLRFDSFFQFGDKYQLAGIEISKLPPMFNFSLIHIKNTLYLYFLQPFSWSSGYRHFSFLPHIHLGQTILPPGQFNYYEPVSGVLIISPIIIFIFVLPFLIKYHIKNHNLLFQKFFSFVKLACLIPLAIIIFFLFCPFISATQRYEMDFTPYLIMLSLISYWLLQKCQLKPWILTSAKYIYIILGIISILIGIDIGITGYGI